MDGPSQRTEEDREFAAITEADIWAEARDRLEIAGNAESDNRKRAKEAMLFREGAQWDQEVTTTVSAEEPELTINLTDALCKRVENNIRQQRPRGKCHPVGDGADVEVAEVINGIGRHVETRSEASVAYDTAASCALDGGFGYFRLIAEYDDPRSFRKDLRILPIRNPFCVDMDPDAIMPHGGDQNWCVISIKMKRQEYRRRYPSAKNINWSGIRDEQRLNWEDEESIRLAEYFRIREIPQTLYLIRGANGEEFTKYANELRDEGGQKLSIDEAAAFIQERGGQIIDDRDSIKRQVEWFRLNGLKVVERQQVPGQFIPVFRVEGNCRDIDGRIMRRGMVESMMDPQRMVNYGETAKIKRLGLESMARYVAAEGQIDGHPEWTDSNQRPYITLTYKPVTVATGQGDVLLPPPAKQEPPQVEAGFAEFVQGMRTNLMAVAGMPNEPGADEKGVVVSGQAIKRRQFLSDQSHFQYYDNTTLAIAQCWRVMVEWIPHYFTEDRMQRIIGEDGQAEMVPINKKNAEQEDGVSKVKNDLSVGKYDVVMDTGPGYETKREEGAENLIELMKVPALAEAVVKSGLDLVFRSIDHPYMQELADRVAAQTPEGMEKILAGLSGRAKSLVQGLLKDRQAMQQQIQTLQQDLKIGLSKAQIQAAAKNQDTQTMAAVKAHDTERRSETQIAVAEIGAAGKIIDSRADRDHEARMTADEMLHGANEAERQRNFEASQGAVERAHASFESDQDRQQAKPNA